VGGFDNNFVVGGALSLQRNQKSNEQLQEKYIEQRKVSQLTDNDDTIDVAIALLPLQQHQCCCLLPFQTIVQQLVTYYNMEQ
jgi:hypothetical protein